MRLGIDFGTTRTVVAVADRGNTPVIGFDTPNGDVQDHVPSVVAAVDGRLVYGHTALDHLSKSGVSGIRSFKRLLARFDAATRPTVRVGDVEVRIDELIAGFLTHLRAAILEGSTNPVAVGEDEALDVWVAVPARASSAQRLLTLEAFAAAGFTVRGLMNEPSAAGIEYAHRYRKTFTTTRQQVLVYDLGGGTFDVSLVDMEEGRHIVLDHAGANDLGGDDFDTVLLELALEQVGSQQTEPMVLLDRCRVAKEGLNPNSRRLTIDLDTDSVSITTAEFYERASSLIQRSIDVIGDILPAGEGDDRFDSTTIAGVYVVGGGSDLPAVARQLRQIFGRRVKRSAYASGATAVGLALMASENGPVVEERFARTLGVFRELSSGEEVGFDPILDRSVDVGEGSKGVVRRYQPAHNVGHFRFAECDRLDDGVPTGDLVPMAEIWVPFDPALRDGPVEGRSVRRMSGLPIIEERYTVDDRGIVTMTLTDPNSGWTQEHVLT